MKTTEEYLQYTERCTGLDNGVKFKYDFGWEIESKWGKEIHRTDQTI